MSKAYEMETMREVWPIVGDGEHWEVGPDRDGLGLVELREMSPDKIVARISFPPTAALLIAEALKLCSQERQASDD